jgi:2-dehydro-3-deoxy-D-arabinonate dehydratase
MLRLYRTAAGPLVETNTGWHPLPPQDWDALINRDDLGAHLLRTIVGIPATSPPVDFAAHLLAPLGTQEIWASGVTYGDGRAAGCSEAEADADTAVGGSLALYRRVHQATRPLLFFKAPHYRVVGPGGDVRFRRDATWNFPEPELTCYITATGRIVAWTIGNDVSAGSIEGENPLYGPQAKVYDASAGLGPCLLITADPPPDTGIRMAIERNEVEVFRGASRWGLMTRSLAELVEHLFRETTFPQGVFLMTGAAFLPPRTCTLQAGDRVVIEVDGIGRLEQRAVSAATSCDH